MKRCITLITFAFVFLLPTISSAQSIEESLEWVKVQYEKERAWGMVRTKHHSSEIRRWSFSLNYNGCDCEFIYRYVDEHNTRGITFNSDVVFNVNLKDLYSNYTLGENFIAFNSLKESVKYTYTKYSPEYPDSKRYRELMDYQAAFYVSNPDYLERIAKALSHAIEKCGGKKEPF